MSDPRRWLDDPATSNRLRVALEQYPRTSAIPTEALDALGRALSSALGNAASVAPGATIGAATITKAGLVAIAIGLGGAGWFGLQSNRAEVAAVAAAPTTVAVAPVAIASAVSVEALALEDDSAQDTARAVEPSAVAPNRSEVATVRNAVPSRSEVATVRNAASRSVAALSTAPSSERGAEHEKPGKSQLEEEATLLEAARKALSTNPTRALEQTARYRERFARPMLGFERDLLEMDALCRLGNTKKAERIANGLFNAQPRGPYAERARAILARSNCGRAMDSAKEPGGLGNQ